MRKKLKTKEIPEGDTDTKEKVLNKETPVLFASNYNKGTEYEDADSPDDTDYLAILNKDAERIVVQMPQRGKDLVLHVEVNRSGLVHIGVRIKNFFGPKSEFWTWTKDIKPEDEIVLDKLAGTYKEDDLEK